MEFTADPLQVDSASDVILAISGSLCAAAPVDELAQAAGFTRGALGAPPARHHSERTSANFETLSTECRAYTLMM